MEIGSEFWDVPTIDKRYLLSGRTALDYILRDVRSERKLNHAILPSYCCHTMIEPFIRNGFQIRFYDVYFEKGKRLCADISDLRKDELFYHMSYFGCEQLQGMDLAEIRQHCACIIDDRTHSWLSDDATIDADYTYTSFRKWAGFYGIAEAGKRGGKFTVETGERGERYSQFRQKAMLMKQGYILNGTGDKQVFLEHYAKAEDLLIKKYVGYVPTEESIWQLMTADLACIKNQRRKNADILLEGLKDITGCELIFPERRTGDTPLFVPILILEKRNELRQYLINNQVYCPVHWPISECHKGISERAFDIYGKEMSLVCDQRYREKDMSRIVCLIKNYFISEGY